MFFFTTKCEATHKSAHPRGQWTVLPHPPYSPNPAPSGYNLFIPLKDAIRGNKYEDDEEVISEVKRWLRQRPAEWYREGTQALTPRWCKATHSEGDYVKK
jgi:hypothetical protein